MSLACQPVNDTGLRRAVLLNDLSCFGKCSLTVGQPILSAAGVEAAVLPTAVLSTHTGGFADYTCLEMTDELEKIVRHWQRLSLHLDAIASGYFCSRRQLDFAARFLQQFAAPDTLVLVDPVMADGGRLYPGFDEAFVEGMRGLCAAAGVITPNLTEALLLAGMPYTPAPDADMLQRCLTRLLAMGAKRVIVTGVQRHPGQDWSAFDGRRIAPAGEEELSIGCVCADAASHFAIWHPFVDTALHGCGDVFSAAFLAAALGQKPAGKNQPHGPAKTSVPSCAWADDADWFADSVHTAADFTHRCVQATDQRQYPGHWYGLRLEDCLAEGFWKRDN